MALAGIVSPSYALQGVGSHFSGKMFKREKTVETSDRRERRPQPLEVDAVVVATCEDVEDRLALSRVRIGIQQLSKR